MSLFKKYRTGLVLSGGGARGMAHLGVMQAMDEEKVKPSIIAGVSAGALAGAFYADGYKPYEILQIFSSKKIFELMRLTFPKTGFLSTHGLKKVLKKNLRSKRVEDLSIPIIIGATNYNEGKSVYFKEGDLVEILLASACIPVLFEVQYINKIPFIDGGVINNLPAQILRKKCKKLIAVHVNPLAKVDKITSPIQIAERTFQMNVASDVARQKEIVDLFIEPKALSGYGMLDIKKAQEIFEIGYKAGKEILRTP